MGKELKQISQKLRYDPNTGDIYWRIQANPAIKPGTLAGHNDSLGYRKIVVNGVIYSGHRLAWLLYYGIWPKGHIDHINGNTSDNRIKNLRCVSHRENHNNRHYHRAGKLVGASWSNQKNKWRSCIVVNGKQKHLGFFKTEVEAHNAYLKALENLNE